MAVINLSGIPAGKGKNPPGLAALYMIDLEAIEAIPAAVSGEITTDLTLASGSTFVEIGIEPEAGAFFTIEEPDANGTTGYNITVNVFVANDSKEQITAIDAIDGVPLALIAVDKKGNKRLLFEQIEGVNRGIRLKPGKEDAGKPGTRKGFLLTGMNDFNNLPPFYTGAITTA